MEINTPRAGQQVLSNNILEVVDSQDSALLHVQMCPAAWAAFIQCLEIGV